MVTVCGQILRAVPEAGTAVADTAFMSLTHCVHRFGNDDSGQDLLEYALLVALIALVAFGAVALAGNSVNAIFSNIAGQLASAV